MSPLKRSARIALGPGYFDEVEIAQRILSRKQGFMVDVGAHRGFAHRPFVEDGWRVLGLEPDPANRAYLEADPHPNVVVDPRAVSEMDGEVLTLYTSEVSSGISTLTPFHESHSAGADVETVRLDTLLTARSVADVDFLKVDTEGHDLPVLRTFPWERMTPDVVVCEFEDRKTVPLGYSYADLGDFLMEHGYVVLMSEWFPVVEYGQAHVWRRVVDYPARVADGHAWGNFIAVRPALARRARRIASLGGWQLAARRQLNHLRQR
jgi:FkbM family methyltransferase